jgi:hypothetical protein
VRLMVLPVSVTKTDGSRQLFDREKVVKTCMRMGATRTAAESIAQEVEARLYDGIETKEILEMIFKRLKRHRPAVRHQIDLRKALSLLNPAPDFELFVQVLLREHGYDVIPNQIVRGRCVEHEIDAVARKSGETYIVEVKHHYNPHTPTSLDVSRISRAVFEDVTEGYELGLNDLKIDRAMIVCNTKLSEHAKRYADCRGIYHIGWSWPQNHDLQTMIEEKQLYPITYLKRLNRVTRKKLLSNQIVLLKQLTEKTPREIRRQTGISPKNLESILRKARAILLGN